MTGGDVIGWLVGDSAQVPPGDDWLTPNEQGAQGRFTVAKRRADWRLGRWTAKRAVRAWLAQAGRGAGAGEIGIVARGDDDGFPLVEGVLAPVPVVSLSHRDGLALCVVGPPFTEIGCDLERIEHRQAAFVHDWFGEGERDQLARAGDGARDELVTLAWSAKEGVLKALGVGLRRDTRSVEVDLAAAGPVPEDRGWELFGARDLAGGARYRCWARRKGPHLLVVVTPTGTTPRPPQHLRGKVSP